MASSNALVQEALAPSAFPGLFDGIGPSGSADLRQDAADAESGAATERVTMAETSAPAPLPPSALVAQLDALAIDIVSTPGAGGALLAAYAAQARALSLVVEAAKRAGGGPLPAAVLLAAQSALVPPNALAGLPFG